MSRCDKVARLEAGCDVDSVGGGRQLGEKEANVELTRSQTAKRARQKVAAGHPSSGTDGWVTPAWLADALGGFALDPCSNDRSRIRATSMLQLEPVGSLDYVPGRSLDDVVTIERRARSKQTDGLQRPWSGSVYVNPPYSNVMPWAEKLVAHEGPWVALLKLDPTTKWWATLMSANPTVAPFRKRIAFETDRAGKTMTAVFPSVLVFSAWRPPAALRPYLWLPSWEAQ